MGRTFATVSGRRVRLRTIWHVLFGTALVAGWHNPGFGAAALDKHLPPAASRIVEYRADIQPILAARCYRCHGSSKQKGDLRLDGKTDALRGGASGAVIIPGKSSDSLLVQYVAGQPEDKLMPASGEPLTADQIGLLRAWIDQGAVWPESSGETKAAEAALAGTDHWALRPPVRSSLPAVKQADWVRNPIDRFILNRLEAEGLKPNDEADRVTLWRRVFFTLTGLLPAPDDLQDFVEGDDDAYARLVDRLLASPHYGERWARHWLDVVRFAESNGFETNTERPNAWPFRDYVIRAFNNDTPFNQFVLEQLAGDALGADEGSGYLVGGPYDTVKSPDVNLTAQQRMDELHDMVSTTGSAFLGLTVGCARCHNHKFDPIPQSDYYAMQAIFAGVQHGERELRPPDYVERTNRAASVRQQIAQLDERLLEFEPLARIPHDVTNAPPDLATKRRRAVHPRQNVDRFASVEAKYIRFTVLETTGAEPCLDELEVYSATAPVRNVALARLGTKATTSGTYAGNEFHKLAHLNDGRFGNARSWISDEPGRGWVQLELVEPTEISRVVWGRDREGAFSDRLATRYRIEVALEPEHWKLVASSDDREPYKPGQPFQPTVSKEGLSPEAAARHDCLQAEKKTLEEHLKALTSFPRLYAGRFEEPGPTYRLNRGEPLQKAEQVSPGALTAIGPPLTLRTNAPERERRLALARWITDPSNPLTARVLVNRLWQHHFGQGLVSTPSDFGHMGARPAHPELLDWLAREFVTHGWSIKHIQRLIILSATFRQSSRSNDPGITHDASSRWLWRFPPQRREAESIRDCILQASGALDLRMGGPGFDLFEPNDNYVKVYNPKQDFGPVEWRRMIYQTKPRMRLDDIFGAFDCPDAGQVAPRRNVSTTPLQALNLLNSPFLLDQASHLARRVSGETGDDAAVRVRRAFSLTFSRAPSAAEEAAALVLAREHGLEAVCRALFNANEFVYVF